MKYALGININHDSSAALLNLENGKIEIALQEERLTRIKFQHGFPKNCIEFICKKFEPREIEVALVGSHSIFDSPKHIVRDEIGILKYLLMVNSDNYVDISNFEIPEIWWNSPLNFKIPDLELFSSTEIWFNETLKSHLNKLGLSTMVKNVNHHQSHMYSALSNFTTKTLIFTLDGEGDHESGTVHLFDPNSRQHPKKLASFPIKNSIGNLYSSVTETYGLKKSRHEGKITGLAAFGKKEKTYPILKQFLKSKEGFPIFGRDKRDVQNFILTTAKELLTILSQNFERRIFAREFSAWKTEIHDLLNSTDFPDLAAGIQKLSEEVTSSIVKHWVNKTGIKDIALSGGVFSNVKINQVLAEDDDIARVTVYPNMGDAGTAIGALYKYYREKKLFVSSPNTPGTASLGPDLLREDTDLTGVSREVIDELKMPRKIALEISENKIIGYVEGRMEWGPRALGNRSILANPADIKINSQLNQRLNRTEYMPFAPATISDIFSEVYEISKHHNLEPFEYMTMACQVKPKWSAIMPAVIHVDGSARPQLVKHKGTIYYSIIKEFYELTGIPAIINTSFNAHEEPIVSSIFDCIRNLKEERIDILYINNERFTLV